jgi:HD superfamily phosphohydrolase
MQRLRGLKQLGVSEMTYVPTTHCRFEHSLGVAALAEALLRAIKKKQPKLDISEKDIICVKIAGLLHDIGHGPYSHVYDGQFRKQLKKAVAKGKWLGQTFDASYYNGLPEVMDGWEHEDGSFMMIDAMLKYLGMEIDEMNLDMPLRQIGDGIRVDCFGICDLIEGDASCEFYDGSTPLPLDRLLTSRDWIFIKECIIGGPLPPKGVSVNTAKKSKLKSKLVGRPDRLQEFLYDVVSNRHSGLDVDKVDYLARDDRRAFGSSGIVDPLLIENAHVAWGKCGRPKKCWICKDSHNAHVKPSADKNNGEHLMICYPEKMVHNAMAFFKQRFRNHQKLYTHHNTNAASYMICDILLLADPFFFLPTADEGDDFEMNSPENATKLKLPVSRANVNPQSYLLLRDSILDVIAATEDVNLRPARILINRFRSHKLYKKVSEQAIVSHDGKEVDIPWQRKLWNMDESEIVSQIVKCSRLKNSNDNSLDLSEDDVIVEKRQIHHGMGAENPVSSMRFLPKSQLSKLRNAPEDLPRAEQIPESDYECAIPRAFLQRTVRIFCRSDDKEVCDHLTTCYHQFITLVQKREGDQPLDFQRGHDFEPNVLSQSPNRCSNESFAISQSSFAEQDDNGQDDNGSNRMKKRKIRGSIFDSVMHKLGEGDDSE